MIKILLLIPPSKENFIRDVQYGCWHEKKWINYSWPPINLYQILAVIDKEFSGKIIDAPALNLNFDNTIEKIKEINPEYLLVSVGSFTFEDDIIFLNKLKEKVNTKVIVYGELPTIKPKFCLKEKSIDFVIRGEPEAIILDILKNKKNIPGFCKKEKISEEWAFVKNLDDLPIAKRDMEMYDKYNNPFAIKKPFTTILTTRGCPNNCIFCTVPLLYKRTFRKRSIENVMEELKLLKNYGFKEIFFRDENITLNKNYIKKLCEQIIKEKLKFSWMCNSRVDTVDEEILKLMKKSGCHLIKFGVESGNQEVLDKIGKGTKIEQIKKTYLLCKKEKIDTVAHFMIGNYGDTKETIKQTMDFAIELNPLYACFDIVLKYPGTKLEKIEKLTELSDDELKRYYNEAFQKFYMRPTLIMKHIFHLKSIDEFKEKTKNTLKLWKGIIK